MDNDDLKEKGIEAAATAVAGPEAGMAVKAVNKYKQSKDKFESVKTGASRFNNGFNDSLTRNRNKQLSDEEMRKTLSRVRERQTNKVAKEKIVKGLNTYMPASGLGDKAERELKTERGEEKLLDAYEEGDSEQEKIANVAKVLERKRKIRKIILATIPVLLPILVIIFLVVLIFKNADTQIYSNENGGTVQSENYEFDNVNINIFANYPGLYEKIIKAVNTVSDKYKIEVDQYLILATLLSPIDNGLVTPVRKDDIVTNNACSEDLCYKYNGEYKTWQEFVDMMGDSAELLAKMQILTFTYENKCKSDTKTMEAYSYNDDKEEHLAWWEWLNPVRWFTGYTTRKEAEKNYVCTDAPQKNNLLPKEVYTLSIDEGEYIPIVQKEGEIVYQKDENSGGVYFWNLVGEDGFLFTYLKDYLYDSDDESMKNLSNSEIYEMARPRILDTAGYIYSYYRSIRKSCDYPDDLHKIIKSDIKEIKVYNPPEKQSRFGIDEHITIDFEDQYIGGVMLAEYNSGNEEALKAFAILARTEAVAVVGLDSKKEIENSSNVQNYNPNYSPEKYPKIAAAVEATRGLVVADYKSETVWHTEYDAFCPVKNTLDGDWYYLPDGQQNLPINVAEYKKITGKQFIDPDSRWLECPCFQNADGRPHDEIINRKYIRYSTFDEAPTSPYGNPRQETKETCWTRTDNTREKNGETQYGWSYKPSGGHGRGASQYGLTYFGAMGYDQDALIRLFFKTAQLRILSSSLPEVKCQSVDTLDMEAKTPGGGSDFDGNGFTEEISGSPLNQTLKSALSSRGNTIDDLNNCIGEKVNSAGYGTRAGVVAAGIGLLQCTMDLTGGYTYPYDHSGGKIGQADLNGKLGVNSRWGEFGGIGCQNEPCRLGLNCANFVRWSMCNGGMNMCSQGSAGARSMTGAFTSTNFFPGAVRIQTSGSFKVMSNSAETSISSKDEAVDAIKPGDVLYSDNNGEGQHAMLIVGKDGSSITIAENGRKTRKISFNELKNGSKTYVVVLLDGYYSDSSNVNSLSW